jgi:hypothetical protein
MATITPRANFGGSKTTTFTGTGANGATLSGGPVKAIVTEVAEDTGHDQVAFRSPSLKFSDGHQFSRLVQKSAPGNNHTRRKVDIQGNAIQSSIVGGHVNNIGTLTFSMYHSQIFVLALPYSCVWYLQNSRSEGKIGIPEKVSFWPLEHEGFVDAEAESKFGRYADPAGRRWRGMWYNGGTGCDKVYCLWITDDKWNFLWWWLALPIYLLACSLFVIAPVIRGLWKTKQTSREKYYSLQLVLGSKPCMVMGTVYYWQNVTKI